jgi:peptide chain release factor subunit 1
MHGRYLKTFSHIDSLVPNKHNHGGQSALRFERLRDDAINEYFKKVAEHCKEAFLDKELKGIIVGGPAMTKENFLKEGYLHHELRKRVVGIVDVGYTNESGLREAADASMSIIADSEYAQEKGVLMEFMGHVQRDDALAVYGDGTKACLERGQVDTLIISDLLPVDELDEISRLAERFGTRLLVSTSENEYGKMFASAFKLGGILRYR